MIFNLDQRGFHEAIQNIFFDGRSPPVPAFLLGSGCALGNAGPGPDHATRFKRRGNRLVLPIHQRGQGGMCRPGDDQERRLDGLTAEPGSPGEQRSLRGSGSTRCLELVRQYQGHEQRQGLVALVPGTITLRDPGQSGSERRWLRHRKLQDRPEGCDTEHGGRLGGQSGGSGWRKLLHDPSRETASQSADATGRSLGR